MANVKIQRTGAADYGQFIKALICGNPGSGKTLISSTFPNPLYASAEGGLMSIADRNIPYVKIESSQDLLAVKHAVDQVPSVREQLLGFPVDTVVIDTIDEIQRILIRERLEETKRDSMSLPDWGWLGEQMQAIIRGFRNLDLNVVITCHLKEVQDNESGRVWFEPGLQGAIGKQISAYVDLALLLKSQTRTKIIDNVAQSVQERQLIALPDVSHEWVKDRSGKLPPAIEVTFTDDYARLSEMIFGGINFPEQPAAEPVVVDEFPAFDPGAAPEPEPTVVASEPALVEVTGGETVENSPEPAGQNGSASPEPEAVPEPTVVEISSADAEVPQKEVKVCTECGQEVSDDQADLSRIRFRKVLCREHHMSAKRSRT